MSESKNGYRHHREVGRYRSAVLRGRVGEGMTTTLHIKHRLWRRAFDIDVMKIDETSTIRKTQTERYSRVFSVLEKDKK